MSCMIHARHSKRTCLSSDLSGNERVLLERGVLVLKISLEEAKQGTRVRK